MQPGRFEIGAAYVGARGRLVFRTVPESGSAADTLSSLNAAACSTAEAGLGSDSATNALSTSAANANAGSASDSSTGGSALTGSISEAGSAVDTVVSAYVFPAQTSEAGSAVDAASVVGSLVANDNESGTAAENAVPSRLYASASSEAPSGSGAAIVGVGPLGASPVGGPRLGVYDDTNGNPASGPVTSDALTAVDSVAAGSVYAITLSEPHAPASSAVGGYPVGATSIGGAFAFRASTASDASAGGVLASAANAETTVSVVPIYALGSSYVGAASAGGDRFPAVSFPTRDASSASITLFGPIFEAGSGLDLLFGISFANRALSDALAVLDGASRGGTIGATAREIAAAVDVVAALGYLFPGIVLTTTGSGAALVGKGFGVDLVTEGSGMSAVTVGSGVDLVTIGLGFSFVGAGSGFAFTGSQIMATKIAASFYYGEDWLILGTATDFQGRALDLTNASIETKIFTNSISILDLSVGDGIAIVDASSGRYRIDVTPTEQIGSEIVPGEFGIQVKIVTADGIVSIQLDGTITVLGSAFP